MSLLEQITDCFKEADQQYIDGQTKWALERREAIREYQKNNRAMGNYRYYDDLYELSGGKGWYNLLAYYSKDQIIEKVTKKCNDTFKSRNNRIMKNLEKHNVTEVIVSEYAETNDGYHGLYKIKTDQGSKVLDISLILAGGYNIQCLHVRSIIKVY